MAKNCKYILGNGIAISPEKDMMLFKEMSKQGWHINGTMMWWYRFEKGEPTDYDYSSNMESKVTEDMLSLYEESGWHTIVACNGFQIFRAMEGATPIFSDLDSEIESLKEIWWDTLKSTVIWGLALIIVRVAAFMMPHSLRDIPWDLLFLMLGGLFIFLLIIFGSQTINFIGICRMLWKKRKQTNKG